MKQYLLFTFCLFLLTHSSDAAFIIKKQREAPATEAAGNQQLWHYHKVSRFSTRLSFRDWTRPRTNDGAYNSGFAIASVILGGVAATCGAICLTAVYLTNMSPAIVVVGLIAAILAVVFGTKGLKSQYKGLAIAGLCLGALTLIGASVAFVIGSLDAIAY